MAYIPTSTITEATFAAGNPSELDYMRPNGFKFLVHNIPNVSFFCQSANIPDVTLGVATQATPLIDFPLPGEKISFGELNIRFLIQENMANYNEIYNWMRGLGSPESSDEYTNYVQSQIYRFPSKTVVNATAALTSEASLFILNSNNIPFIKIVFQEVFPVALSGLDFDLGNSEYFQGLASFRYRQYKIEAA
jgi:hypothetical protein